MTTARPATEIDELAINTIRTLAMDAVQKANSGHPGTPMALAPVIYTLWRQFLRYDLDDPLWPNRDRFVLSNGHASMLLYATLHLAGVRDVAGSDRLAVDLDDIQAFRELGSRCPGHPGGRGDVLDHARRLHPAGQAERRWSPGRRCTEPSRRGPLHLP